MQSILALLISTFLLSPLQDAITRKLTAAGVSQAAAQNVTQCVTNAAPQLAGRAVQDPVWLLDQLWQYWAGGVGPEAMLAKLAPQCSNAFEAVRKLARPGI
ncbi:hypothetical protein [Bosea sp. ANAM02]|uniref:hypothetical protein n=1 Tax=Bosea sp. ANAM02 TaxID=2020412 RepID=UPI00140EADC9|nr:hypothetical protein [Bosea sp. ANAM02]BCB17152.1 hypothetical protein OCUBac02_00460 [Bosea sp. ANAM02]